MEYSIEFARKTDRLKELKLIHKATTDNIVNVTFEYEFFENNKDQLILTINWDFDIININSEQILDIYIETAFVIANFDELKNATFKEFIPILNMSFNRAVYTSEKYLVESGVEFPKAPDLPFIRENFYRFVIYLLKGFQIVASDL